MVEQRWTTAQCRETHRSKVMLKSRYTDGQESGGNRLVNPCAHLWSCSQHWLQSVASLVFFHAPFVFTSGGCSDEVSLHLGCVCHQSERKGHTDLKRWASRTAHHAATGSRSTRWRCNPCKSMQAMVRCLTCGDNVRNILFHGSGNQ